jgi:hypothetical protein
MRARPRLPLALVALTAAALASPAGAQVVPSPYDFIETSHDTGGTVGYIFENRGDLDMGPGGGASFGVRYSIKLGGPFALEGNAFLLPTDRNVYEATPTEDDAFTLVGNTSSLVGGLDARLRLTLTGPRTWNGLAPYVALGGGVADDLRGRSEMDELLTVGERFNFGPSFLGVLAGGTRWLPTENTTVRAEGLLNLWRLGAPAEFTRVQLEERRVADREWAGVWGVVVGFSYRF